MGLVQERKTIFSKYTLQKDNCFRRSSKIKTLKNLKDLVIWINTKFGYAYSMFLIKVSLTLSNSVCERCRKCALHLTEGEKFSLRAFVMVTSAYFASRTAHRDADMRNTFSLPRGIVSANGRTQAFCGAKGFKGNPCHKQSAACFQIDHIKRHAVSMQMLQQGKAGWRYSYCSRMLHWPGPTWESSMPMAPGTPVRPDKASGPTPGGIDQN